MDVPEEELEKRRAAFTPRELSEDAAAGTLRKYVKLVSPASEGCVTDA